MRDGPIRKDWSVIRLALPCVACAKPLENIFESPNQPSGGTAFATGGHYGSTVFDPMDGTQLEINVCDGCLTAAGKARRVLHYRHGQRAPVSWKPPASVDTVPKGGDAKQAPCASNGSAVGEAETP